MSQFCIGKKNKRKDLLSTILNKNGAGFTLVELLAVIAIIALLASIVVVRIGVTRKKGEDAAIQSALRELRNVAELYYNDSPFTYEGVCDAGDITLSDDGDFKKIKDYITKYNGTGGVIGCRDGGTGYAVISSLNLGNCWCVDSQGASREVTLTSGDCRAKLTGVTCPD